MATVQAIQEDVARLVIDLPAAVTASIPNLVRLAHREAQVRHNFKIMEARTAQLPTVLATRVLAAIPSDWKEARGRPWYTEAQGEVHRLRWGTSRSELAVLWGEDPDLDFGPPYHLLRSEPTNTMGATNVEVWPFPDGLSTHDDGEYRITIPYWKFVPLPATSAEDWLTVNGEEYITWRAAAEGFFRDWDEERGTLWFQRAEGKFQELRRLDKKLVLSEGGETLSYHLGAEDPDLD